MQYPLMTAIVGIGQLASALCRSTKSVPVGRGPSNPPRSAPEMNARPPTPVNSRTRAPSATAASSAATIPAVAGSSSALRFSGIWIASTAMPSARE